MEKPKHMFTYSMYKALTVFKGVNSGTVNKIWNYVNLLNFNIWFPAFLTKMFIKVLFFTNIENRCLNTNNEKRGPETDFAPARETI